VLDPATARQHLLHVALFQRVLESVAAEPPPAGVVVHVVADPFVLTSADLNAAYRDAGPRAMGVIAPVGFVARVARHWQRRSDRPLVGPIAVASMLALDNVYDWQTGLAAWKIDPAGFGRSRFDEFIRGSG
jgi:hypothetical protein